MRKVYADSVRKEFERRFVDLFPQFKRSADKVYPGTRLYEYRVHDDLTLYIYLIFHKYEEFTLEIAWSEHHRYPEIHTIPGPEDDPINGEMEFRISRFWHRQDPWWAVQPRDSGQESIRRMRELDFSDPPAELYLPRVPGLVDDALNKLVQYAVPYFEKVAADHGCEIKLIETK